MKRPSCRLIPPIGLLLVFAAASMASESNFAIKGFGFLGNMELERRVEFLTGRSPEDNQLSTLAEVEDTAFIILQFLRKEGYPEPRLSGNITFLDGTTLNATWTLPYASQVDMVARERPVQSVTFHCQPGRLNHYRSVTIKGIEQAMEPEKAQGYFLASGVLFILRSDQAFTMETLNRRISNLLYDLREMGYQSVEIRERSVEIDEESGAVDVELALELGPLHRVGNIHVELDTGEEPAVADSARKASGRIFNETWLGEFRQKLQNAQYRQGYPDTRIHDNRLPTRTDGDEEVLVDLSFTIDRGPLVTFTGATFEPAGSLRPSILGRTLRGLDPGDPFNLLQIEKSRRELMALGVFESVDIRIDDTDPARRGVTYRLFPLPERRFVLRVGWGSYEQARAGFYWEHRNPFKRAHRYRLEAMQSMKSTEGELTYVMPQFFDRRITGYGRIRHEYREEIDFDRTTSQILFGASQRFLRGDLELVGEYSIELQDSDREAGVAGSVDQLTVSSVILQANYDKRDNPLFPSSGFDLGVTTKTASEFLGGSADFRKVELSGTYHRYLGSAVYLHVGLEYGAIFSEKPTERNLPFNERFFLGGENSIRGYRQGDASPRTSEGKQAGAEAYFLANIELEQRILSNFSVVVFLDSLFQSESHETIPRGESLYSLGLGLRLRTPVGPVRLEYGHNLNRRHGDPDGTLHFSVGYPF